MAPQVAACVRFYRRPDGRVLTADCLSVVRRMRRRAWLTAAAVLGALGLGGAAWARAAAASYDGGLSDPKLWQTQPFRALAKVLPESWVPEPRRVVAGRLMLPPTPSPFPQVRPGGAAVPPAPLPEEGQRR